MQALATDEPAVDLVRVRHARREYPFEYSHGLFAADEDTELNGYSISIPARVIGAQVVEPRLRILSCDESPLHRLRSLVGFSQSLIPSPSRGIFARSYVRW